MRTTALERLQELDTSDARKQLFLAFAPLWNAINAGDEPDSPYRRMIASLATDAPGASVSEAAASLAITADEIERWLKVVLEAWRSHARGSPIEPWDYWYDAAEASRELKTAIPRSALLPISERFYRDLGADLNELGVLHDLEPRPGKAPLAYEDHVRIGRRLGTRWRPAIARVSANYEEGSLFALNELVHEDGHAAHESAVHVRPAFYSLGGDLFDEAFADVPSWSTFEPAWQHRYLGVAASVRASQRELFANVMLDVAWGLFDLTMQREPATDPNALWSTITSRYLNVVPHPELSWWALRAQLVRYPGYMINYGLGAVLTADLRARVVARIGTFDTGNARWYPWLSAQLLRFGSSLHTATLLHRFLGRPVSPDALLKSLQRLEPSADAQLPAPP